MISAGEFQKRRYLRYGWQPSFQIIEFQHVKPGKGAAFVRTKIRNVISGAVYWSVPSTPLKSSPPLTSSARICSTSTATSDLYYFMDNETYENCAD